MSSEVRSGTDALRATLRTHRRNGALLARDLGVAAETLHRFADGRGGLVPHVLQKLAIELFGGHIVYDIELDALQNG